MTHNGEALDGDYEEDFTEFPEEEEDEDLLVRRFPAVRRQESLAKQSTPPSGTEKSTVRGSETRKPAVRSGTLKTGSSTGLVARDGLRKTASTGMNQSLRLPQIRPPRSDITSGMSRRPADHVSERVLSARANRVHELENERNLLRAQVQELKREVQTLNQLLRRHSKALGQYEGGDDGLPTLLQKSEEEARVTREHLRNSRQKYGLLREHYRQLEIYSQTVEKEREKLAVMVRDKGLQDSKALKDERDTLLQQLDDARDREKEFERRISSLQKAQTRERQYSDSRLRDSSLQLEKLDAENASLKEQLKSALAYKERSRTQVQDRKSVTGTPGSAVIKSPMRTRVAPVDRKSDHHQVLLHAKPSFIQEFNAVTGAAPSPPANSKAPENVQKVITVEISSKNPSSTWKPRTSPDLLRDHEERIVFGDLPSSSSSLASSTSVIGKDGDDNRLPVSEEWRNRAIPEPATEEPRLPVRQSAPEETTRTAPVGLVKHDNVLKNDLLEKIRLLDVSRKETSARRVDESTASISSLGSKPSRSSEPLPAQDSLNSNRLRGLDDSFQTRSLKPVETLSHTATTGRFVSRVQSDDEIEEIEFF